MKMVCVFLVGHDNLDLGNSVLQHYFNYIQRNKDTKLVNYYWIFNLVTKRTLELQISYWDKHWGLCINDHSM